jgi:hypothetical protein
MGNPPSLPRSPIALLQSVTKLWLTFKVAHGIKRLSTTETDMTAILEAFGAVTLFGIAAFFLIFVF